MKKISHTLLSIFAFSLPFLARAEDAFPDPLQGATLDSIFSRILSGLVMLGGLAVTVVIIWGAYILMFSEGNPKKIETAKKTILYAVVGYGILLLAGAVRLVIEDALSH